MEQHKSSGKRGEQSKQTSDEPDWFYEKSDWDKTIDKWRNKVADKYYVENKCGVWKNDRKAEPGWHWVGVKENAKNGNDNAPDLKVGLRPIDRDSVDKYCSEIQVLTPEQAKEMWSKPGSQRIRNDKEMDSDIPF